MCFLPLPVSMQSVYAGEEHSGVRSSVDRGSDVVSWPQRRRIGARLCVIRSLQGTRLHADSHLFVMQKYRKDQRSVHVLQLVGGAEKEENKQAEIETSMNDVKVKLDQLRTNQKLSEQRWGDRFGRVGPFQTHDVGRILSAPQFFQKLVLTTACASCWVDRELLCALGAFLMDSLVRYVDWTKGQRGSIVQVI